MSTEKSPLPTGRRIHAGFKHSKHSNVQTFKRTSASLPDQDRMEATAELSPPPQLCLRLELRRPEAWPATAAAGARKEEDEGWRWEEGGGRRQEEPACVRVLRGGTPPRCSDDGL